VAKPSRGPGIIAASYIPERPPLLWYLIGLVVTLGVVLHSLAVLIARYNWKELGARWWLEYFTLDHGGGRYVQGRAFFLFVATIQVAIAQLVILAPTWRLQPGYSATIAAVLVCVLSSPRHKMRVLIQMRAMMKRRKAFS